MLRSSSSLAVSQEVLAMDQSHGLRLEVAVTFQQRGLQLHRIWIDLDFRTLSNGVRRIAHHV
jgi:hypothetical protein